MKLKDTIKRFILEGVCGCILWTIFLTPYTIFIMRTTLEQYVYWVIMEFMLVFPLAPFVHRITKRIVSGNGKKKKSS